MYSTEECPQKSVERTFVTCFSSISSSSFCILLFPERALPSFLAPPHFASSFTLGRRERQKRPPLCSSFPPRGNTDYTSVLHVRAGGGAGWDVPVVMRNNYGPNC